METTLLLMLLGSALHTGAPTTAFPMLILGCAIQGIFVASINIIVRTILEGGMLLKKYAKNNSSFFIVAGLNYALGPVIGGYATEITTVGILLVVFVL
ncbi:hypothetical protein BOTCAL_0600g00030 [Botryotinia calthae]|uniref:Major facilitator superfamily (MFS) profile domain-containing protein n=1 Tax=Botryotinia calthae TaxID=38488 RepID=A0A4Y8CKP2_9HELO|nr:hypothetical protein BOTCAL_0600g00030 [Botryotinia calthae]